MSLFLVLATVLLVATLALVLHPLLRKSRGGSSTTSAALALDVLREQLRELEQERQSGTLSAEQYAAERGEIERRAIEDAAAPPSPQASPARVGLAMGVALLLLGVSVSSYLALGTPEAMDAQLAQGADGQATAVTPAQTEAMAERLAARLKAQPNDGEGWRMLGRSRVALRQYPAAAQAYAEAVRLLPAEGQLLADYAEAQALTQERKLAGEPEALLKRALVLDPGNVKALALLGSAAFARQEYAAASGYWKTALERLPAESEAADGLRQVLAEAESRSGKPSATAAKVSIGGTVSLAPALKSKLGPSDVVFVFARPADGTRMPLAVRRFSVSDLPAQFVLDDSAGMGGSARLSDHPQLIIGARISHSGNAIPQRGDLESPLQEVSLGARGMRLVVSRQRP